MLISNLNKFYTLHVSRYYLLSILRGASKLFIRSVDSNLSLSLLTTYILFIFLIAMFLEIAANLLQKLILNQQTHTNFYIQNPITPHTSLKVLLKRNYFALYVYHPVFKTSYNLTAFLNLLFSSTAILDLF